MKNLILIGMGVVVGVALRNAYAICKPPKKYVIKGGLQKDYNAQTIPPFGVFIKKGFEDNQALWEHELVHWKQYQKLGLMGFYMKYFSQYLKDGYNDMEMEKEARFNESPFCMDNYLKCKEIGIARTSKT